MQAAGAQCSTTGTDYGSRVLIVEDHGVNQLVARKFLERAGYTCDVVDDGAAAVDAILDRPYPVVLMDLQMPVMDGYEATRAIRSHPSLADRQPIIIAMTAFAQTSDRNSCMAVGMNDYITKPLNPSLLESILAQHLAPGSERVH